MKSVLKREFGQPFRVKRHVLSFLIITLVCLIAMQIPFRHIWGTSKSFTLFDFLAPTMGALWGTTIGIISVLAVSLFNLILKGDYSLSAFIRLIPVLFAIFYFARRTRGSALIGLIAMVLFIAHPIGRQAWMYSLYWLIPLVSTLISRDHVFTTALGATFTQHAVGSIAFLYAYGYTPAFWKALIPVVAGERLVLAIGMAVSYVAIQALVRRISALVKVAGLRKANKVYVVAEN